jgi:maltose O-acetyltransferase
MENHFKDYTYNNYPHIFGSDINDILWFNSLRETAREPIIGTGCVIGWGSIIDCAAQVTIGDNTFFGHRVMILTGTHDYMKFGEERRDTIGARPVTIGNGVWIASGAIICPGVTIGDNAVVGAGSVVMKNVLPYTMVAGNPAIKIRKLK